MKTPNSRADQFDLLVVDDEIRELRLLSDMLKSEGYNVRAVSDGDSAIRACVARPPDLILLDIHLKGIDGYAICEQLKADPRTTDIAVIFITGHAGSANQHRGFAVGAVDYITKPFAYDDVCHRVATHLHLKMQYLARIQARDDELQHTLHRLLPWGFVQRIYGSLGADLQINHPVTVGMTMLVVQLPHDITEIKELNKNFERLTRTLNDVQKLVHSRGGAITNVSSCEIVAYFLGEISDPVSVVFDIAQLSISQDEFGEYKMLTCGLHRDTFAVGLSGSENWQRIVITPQDQKAVRALRAALSEAPAQVIVTTEAYRQIVVTQVVSAFPLEWGSDKAQMLYKVQLP